MADNIRKVKARKITGRKPVSQLDIGKKYFEIIAAVYNIDLTEMEINLLAHTALWGTISTPPAREDFVTTYGSSKASLNNLISKLQKKKLLIKDNNLKIRVLPAINISLDQDYYVFNINLEVENE